MAQTKALAASKNLLTSDKYLTHFDSSLKLTLTCDASAYGLGVVLSHKIPDGSERPIAYSSCTLNVAECKYSHMEKEVLRASLALRKITTDGTMSSGWLRFSSHIELSHRILALVQSGFQ